MKTINSFIIENASNHSKYNKVVNALDNSISQAILKRTKAYDENRFDWSRDPMFLIADKFGPENNGENRVRDLRWVQIKFIDTYLEGPFMVNGTIDNYQLNDDSGQFPCSVLGIFIDRQFLPISTIESFKKIIDILKEE